MNTETSTHHIDFDTPALKRHRRMRKLKDHLTRWYVTVGGLAILAAITLIFFYLGSVILPMFQGAQLQQEQPQAITWSQDSQGLYLAIEEQNQVGLRLNQQGQAQFFNAQTGQLLDSISLALPADVEVTAIAQDQPGSRTLALGLSNGQVLVVEHNYKVSYPNNVKTIQPSIDYPYGEQALTLADTALDKVGISASSNGLVLVGSVGAAVHALKITRDENIMTGEVTLADEALTIPTMDAAIKQLLIDPRHQWLYVFSGNSTLDVFDLRRNTLNGRYKMANQADTQITASSFLLGGISLLVGDSKGGISQWFMVRGEDGLSSLQRIRDFQQGDSAITQILPEERRKGFLALDAKGTLGVYHSTAHRTLLKQSVAEGAALASLAPRANLVLVEQQGQLQNWRLDNPHPEISWSALWGKVWYESYAEPDYVWQSTSANSDFEPKLSLAPLAFGTLKAAFYAMLLAAPLAICAAIYTGYFMAPALRSRIKPVIELMEALPTVILGFFAGLFLAPFLESHLPGIFSLLLLMPFGILLAAWAWSRLPEKVRLAIPDGWEAALLIPVVIAVGLFSLGISGHLENWFFGGDMRLWLSNDLGIPFDQRNALVVGLAMGFAVIPNIYSIAEDAVFSVPRSLTFGSLALGATPWQTLTRVVILTASPGIFSALMIGMGRAVGETMIVLMATGNTPIMEVNIFEGLRTLAANVAVEMPESEVGSSHYRVLFLAAMVLLMFTFVMNTVAELIRSRLRSKYASL